MFGTTFILIWSRSQMQRKIGREFNMNVVDVFGFGNIFFFLRSDGNQLQKSKTISPITKIKSLWHLNRCECWLSWCKNRSAQAVRIRWWSWINTVTLPFDRAHETRFYTDISALIFHNFIISHVRLPFGTRCTATQDCMQQNARGKPSEMNNVLFGCQYVT